MSDFTPSPDPPAPSKWAWLVKLLPTNWRAFVAWAVTLGCVYVGNCIRRNNGDAPLPLPEPPLPVFPAEPFGWRPPTEAERQATLATLKCPRWEMTEAAAEPAGPDDDAPVWRLYARVTAHPFPAFDQGQIGCCVAFGTSAAAEFSLCARINAHRGPPQQFTQTIREAVYGGSRINADPANPIRGGDGSTGERASRWLRKGTGGLLPEGTYAGQTVTGYDVSRCRTWGDRGVPGNLLPACQDNACETTLVTAAADARTALQQGYAIFICSDVGFGDLAASAITRDADGFLKARGTWPHCMCIAGYQGGPRKGFLIVNSWGDHWVTGPTGRFADIPAGSFWADFATVDRMLKQGDSFAVAGVEGFRRRKIDPSDWTVSLPLPRRTRHDFLAP